MRRLNALTAVFALLSGLLAAPTLALDYETPPSLAARDVATPELVRGPNHELVEPVVSDGWLNTYIIDSPFGQFEAQGHAELATRVREIDALAYLQAMSRSEVFIESLKKAGVGSVDAIVKVFTNPVQTIGGLPAGVRKLFTGYARTAERGLLGTRRAVTGGNPDELDPLAFRKSNYLLSDGEREWASELKIDPYTTNLKLRRAISDMAVVQFVGGLPVDIALPMTASFALGALGNDERIYVQTASELEAANRQCLAGEGFTAQDSEAFIQADFLTPTMQTAVCRDLMALSGVTNREELVHQLVDSQSFEEARFLTRAIGLLADFNTHRTPLASIVSDSSVPEGLTRDGRLIVMLPVDLLYWTQETATTMDRISSDAEGAGVQVKELWITGRSSDLAARALGLKGWRLFGVE